MAAVLAGRWDYQTNCDFGTIRDVYKRQSMSTATAKSGARTKTITGMRASVEQRRIRPLIPMASGASPKKLLDVYKRQVCGYAETRDAAQTSATGETTDNGQDSGGEGIAELTDERCV